MINQNEPLYVIDEMILEAKEKLDELCQQVIHMHVGYLNDIYHPSDDRSELSKRNRQYDELNTFFFIHRNLGLRLSRISSVCLDEIKKDGEKSLSARDKVQEQLDNYRKKFDQ